jgi:hypothetical protein
MREPDLRRYFRIYDLVKATLPNWVFLAAGAAIAASLALSVNSDLWMISIAALTVGTYCIGWPTHYPVLLWIVGINWLPIAADILRADVADERVVSSSLGSYRTEAILISLFAGVVLAIGLRLGARAIGYLPSPIQSSSKGSSPISLRGSVMLFFSAYPIIFALGLIGYLSPGLRQPAWAFASLKFVFLYLLAATVFRLQRGYEWLLLAVTVELVSGFTGFFSDYKEAFFIVLIALVSERKTNAKLALLAGVIVVLVVWLTLIWTAIKPEYRMWVSGYTGAQIVVRPFGDRVDYLVRAILSEGLDYEAANLKLLKRLGYTEYYSKVLARLETSTIDVPSRYVSAVQSIVMPRLFFADKPELNDTAVTTALTGEEIDPDTSVSVGYVAEAHVDFGFPAMMVPILLIGVMVGAQARYFMTRDAPLIVRRAFCTGCLFSSFGYAMNIDKAFGANLLGFIAMSLALKFGYPLVSTWLADRSYDSQNVKAMTI